MDYACRSCRHFQPQPVDLSPKFGVCTHPARQTAQVRILIRGDESPRCYRGMGDDDFVPSPEDRLIDQRFLPPQRRGLRADGLLPLIPVYQDLAQAVSD